MGPIITWKENKKTCFLFTTQTYLFTKRDFKLARSIQLLVVNSPLWVTDFWLCKAPQHWGLCNITVLRGEFQPFLSVPVGQMNPPFGEWAKANSVLDRRGTSYILIWGKNGSFGSWNCVQENVYFCVVDGYSVVWLPKLIHQQKVLVVCTRRFHQDEASGEIQNSDPYGAERSVMGVLMACGNHRQPFQMMFQRVLRHGKMPQTISK